MKSSNPKVCLKFHVGTGRTGHRELRDGTAAEKPISGRIPRISRLMALAIRLEQLLREGVVRDQAELAQLGMVTRARMTQIMGLLTLATEIQEVILFLPPVVQGDDPIHEHQLRQIVAQPDWQLQTEAWLRLCSSVGSTNFRASRL